VESSATSRATAGAAEVAVTVAAATSVVAALDRIAPVTGLGVIYLLGVLSLAIRRGNVAALAGAVASVLAFNFFFIEPVHRLTISDSENVAALVVFLIAAVVVGRLASAARMRAAEAEDRARVAAAREAEAEMLTGVAAMLLEQGDIEGHTDEIARRLGDALGTQHVRLEFAAAPATFTGERDVRLPTRTRPAWLYVPREQPIGEAESARVLSALAGIIDVAVERERVAASAADAEATRRADVVKTALLHAISHDLRSPLTAISTAASALMASDLALADRTELTLVVRDESQRLARLIDDLLDLSRVEANALDPQWDWCDLHDVVASAAEPLRARAPGTDPIAIELPAELPLVRADPSQLERVFFNLLDNAVRFAPPQRPVRVRGGTGAGHVTVRVIDEGPGIPPSRRATIFEPFSQGRGAQGGAGLGLAICRGFVEANNGRIVLQTGSGEGTAFAVSLPLVPQPVASA
jgi:two-component system sensor histidine kinase KdpD